MVFGGGTFELNVDNSFLKTRYNAAYVSYPDSTTVVVASGATTRIIGEPITTTSVRSYQLKFTNYGTDICFGLISTPDIDSVTLDGGDFSEHWGVCVGATYPTGQLVTECPCDPCATGCATCTGAASTDCTSCITGYYYETTCKPCHAACSACFDYSSVHCTACKPGYFLHPASTICADYCPDRHWKDTTNNTCVPCDIACSACLGSSNSECSACNSGYFLQPSPESTTCLNSCPSGYWKDITNHICDPCNAACSACTGSLNSQCSTCNTNYYLQPPPAGTTCDSTCPNGYWRDDASKKCQSCHHTCSICTGTGNYRCSACNLGYFLRSSVTTCASTCTPGYWGNTSSNTCEICDSSCSVCTGPNNNQCSACNSGFFRQPAPASTTCLNSCPNGYWENTANKVCASCHIWCSECTGPNNNQCSACNSGFFRQPAPSGTVCLNYCPTGYGGNPTTKICVLCDSSCLVCTGSLNSECSACNPGYFLQPAPSTTTCLNSCPATGYWKDATNHICVPCDAACSICTGSNNDQCSECNVGYFLQPSPATTTCLDSCPVGYWGDPTSNTCTECDIACAICTGIDNTQCSACKPGYFLQPDSTICLSSCPVIYYYPDTTLHACRSKLYFSFVFNYNSLFRLSS